MRAFRNGRAVAPKLFFAGLPREERFHVETLARTLHLLNAGRFLGKKNLIFINFDPSLLSHPQLADEALDDMRLVLREAGVGPRRVVCEVTEQKAHSDTGLQAFVQALRQHGLRIAVDDYGEASSDVRRIEDLDPDIVKFDARWIARLMESGPGLDLLAKMVQEFAERGIMTVFEGIEERWQLDLAARSGASMVQGFALARPQLAPTEFAVPDADGNGDTEPFSETTPASEAETEEASADRQSSRSGNFGRQSR